jgi:signal peptidase I
VPDPEVPPVPVGGAAPAPESPGEAGPPLPYTADADTEASGPLDPAVEPAVEAVEPAVEAVEPAVEAVEPAEPPRRRVLLEWGAVIAVAVVAALLLRTFVIQLYFIPSGSMEPTLKVNDKVLVNRLSYDFHGVHRGDVIVFKKPATDYAPGITDLIKRVIGLPGETVSASGGHVYINGNLLKEPWLPKGVTTGNFGPYTDSKNCYFVMGDNRDNSADSRYIDSGRPGCIPGNLIIGRAFMITWPPSRIGGL